MTVHGFTALNYAAQINGTTVITRAFKKKNAVARLRQHDADLKSKDVYVYEGITGSTTVDEVYNDPIRVQDEKGNYWKDVYQVRMKEEYAQLL